MKLLALASLIIAAGANKDSVVKGNRKYFRRALKGKGEKIGGKKGEDGKGSDCKVFSVHLSKPELEANRLWIAGEKKAGDGPQPCYTTPKGIELCVGDTRVVSPTNIYLGDDLQQVVGEYTSNGKTTGVDPEARVVKHDYFHSIRFDGHPDITDGTELFFVDHAETGADEIIMAVTGGIGDFACAVGIVDWVNRNLDLDIYICDTCASSLPV